MGVATLAFFFWGYRPEIKRNPAVIIYVLVALVFLGAFAVFIGKGSIGFERMRRTLLYAKGDRGRESRGSGASRSTLYKDAWRVLMRYPVTGVGLLQFSNYNPRGKVSHSEFGEISTSTGLPGTVIYGCVWIILWRRSGRLFRSKRDPVDARIGGLFRAIIIVLAFSGLGAPVYSAKWVWTMLGAYIGYAMTVEEEDKVIEHQHAWQAFHYQQMLAAQASWRKSQAQATAAP
jgi:O-antigen ligase